MRHKKNSVKLFMIIGICMILFESCSYTPQFLTVRDKILMESIYGYEKLDDFFIQYQYCINYNHTVKVELLKWKNKLYINKYSEGNKQSFSEHGIISKDKIIKEWNSSFMRQWTDLFYKVFYMHNQFNEVTLNNDASIKNYSKEYYEVIPKIDDEEGINQLFGEKGVVKFFISKDDTLINEYYDGYEKIYVKDYIKSSGYRIPKNIVYSKKNKSDKEFIIIEKFSIGDSSIISNFTDIINLENSNTISN